MRYSEILALAATLSSASAAYQGFNYGATKSDGSFMFEADFEASFKNAKNLVGTSGFTSARLYTMIQGGSSTNDPTEAIQAAINQNVTLLLGLWASGGAGGVAAEIDALQSAISKWGTDFTDLVAGISVGSEDLYRISPTGIAALSGAGANPDDLVTYIQDVRTAIEGTSLSDATIGHVDTWTAWTNGSNSAVIEAVDWIGMDAYPYFQNTMANSIDTGKQLFNDALSATQAVSTGKEVWVTETGWPVSGSTQGQGVPSTANAKTYWDQVGCPLFGNTNVWWYTMQDSDPTTPNPSFGLVGSTLSTTPLYDLSCANVTSSASTSTTSTSPSASSSLSSVLASLSSAATATAPLATGTSGLTPGGINVPSGSGSSNGTSGSGSGSGSGTGSTTTTSTSSSGSSTSSPITNSAASLSGSLLGAFAVVFAAVLVL